ncbi:MAG: box helicase [bacterium]|nr:box helicase [bacterium]
MSLASLAVGVETADDVLSRFVAHVGAAGLSLYPAQEEAILELCSGKHVILNTPTGSGKSLVATALHFKAIAEGKSSFYTCPIKALVNEKFFALCEEFGPENVGMLTGDAAINPTAKIVCCTAEILSNLALRDRSARVEYVVMDEFHYYGDKERGVAWQIPLLACNDATFLLMSATLGDTAPIETSLKELTGRDVAVVRSSDRPVPLDFEYRETPLHETLEKLIEGKRYPVYLVNFTQRAAAEQAQNLTSLNICNKEEKAAIAEALTDVKFDTPYAKEFQRFVRNGIGLHHAGLLPKYRLLVEKLAQQGLLKVVSGTDTLGMGINIPIRTVLFTQLCKYDGEKTAVLSARDFHQISGRAGRKGFDERGSVVAQAPEHVIENLKLGEKKAQGKKVVMQKPPQKGYVHWDRQTFERLIERQPEPLESRFGVTHGMLLSLLQGDPRGYRRLVQLIARAHSNDYGKRQQRRVAARLFRTLRTAGLIDVVRDESARHPLVEVSIELQRDFSLNHSLSMYLVDTVRLLDRASETYALDVLSLVESILENPQVVLYAQVDRLKTQKLDELKAAGVEYAERMEELDKITWPKPLGELIYDTFNAFAAKHPWLGQENIRPKSVARDLLERFCSFHDYVRDYGLQRSEGVLLRYLSQAYKALLQTVPEALRTEELDDIIEQLRAMLRAVDSSLLDEWQSLRELPDGVVAVRTTGPAAAPPPPPLAEDSRALGVRVRGELHRLLQALARKQWDEALAALRPGGDEVWTTERLAAEVAPYFAEHATIDVTPPARRPSQTVIEAAADPGTFTARQRILDPAGDEDWMIDGFVDARGTIGDAPIIELRGVRR